MLGFKGIGRGGVAGVRSFNGQTGVVGYAPVLSLATVGDLAALPTLGALTTGGLQTGQQAFVATVARYGALTYELVPTVSAAPDALNIIATSDDATRQWVRLGMVSGAVLAFVSAELDVTALSAGNLIAPPMTGRRIVRATTFGGMVTAVGGAIVGPATIRAGTDAGVNNFTTTSNAYFSNFNFGSGVGTAVFAGTPTGIIYPAATPLVVDVTIAATGGVGFIYKGRAMASVTYQPA